MSRKSIVKEVTYGVFGSLLDLIIWQVFLVGASFGKTGPRGVTQAFNEADELLQKINHQTLSSTWHQLRKKRLLTYQQRKNLYSPEISDIGKKRLEESLPQYFNNRPWDKKIYLITYDIPEKYHAKRDLLRYFLIKLKCKLLQESVWLTPYNPRQLIKKFVKANNIAGMVIISDIGSDGGIGEFTIQDLLVRLYNLESLNEKYETFIQNAKKNNKSLKYLMFEFLSVLKHDPQLPFPLLPKRWQGDKANALYEKLKKKYILSFRGRGTENI